MVFERRALTPKRIYKRLQRARAVRAFKNVLADLEKSGLTLEQQLLLVELITECRRIAIWRDTTEIDEILHWLRKELHYPARTPRDPLTSPQAYNDRLSLE